MGPSSKSGQGRAGQGRGRLCYSKVWCLADVYACASAYVYVTSIVSTSTETDSIGNSDTFYGHDKTLFRFTHWASVALFTYFGGKLLYEAMRAVP